MKKKKHLIWGYTTSVWLKYSQFLPELGYFAVPLKFDGKINESKELSFPVYQ